MHEKQPYVLVLKEVYDISKFTLEQSFLYACMSSMESLTEFYFSIVVKFFFCWLEGLTQFSVQSKQSKGEYILGVDPITHSHLPLALSSSLHDIPTKTTIQ